MSDFGAMFASLDRLEAAIEERETLGEAWWTARDLRENDPLFLAVTCIDRMRQRPPPYVMPMPEHYTRIPPREPDPRAWSTPKIVEREPDRGDLGGPV